MTKIDNIYNRAQFTELLIHVLAMNYDKIAVTLQQSYEIKSPPWTIWLFRILGIFSIENIDRLGDFMFQTSDNSQLCIDSQNSSQ